MTDFRAQWRQKLDAIAAADRYRHRRVVQLLDRAEPMRIRVDGTPALNFCSNDYLGLSAHPAVRAAMLQATHEYGVGSGASHLVTGHHAEHHALEQELAQFVGRERALLFSTGYMANLGVVGTLAQRGDAVFEDRLNHASLIDAGLLSGARFARYAHRDPDSLTRQLLRSRAPAKLVITDGVFSMDGDVAPLAELAEVCATHATMLMVDDAHGFGVIGPQGRGCVSAAGLDDARVPIYMATLGKALGVAGAFVAGSHELIELLIQKARTYIYTTALPAPLAAAIRAALRVLQTEPERLAHLHDLIDHFKRGAAQLGLPLLPSDTAIQPLLCGSSVTALRASECLLQRGLMVSAIRPPTVPAHTARLRITLSALHRHEHVDALLEALSYVKERLL